MSARRKNVPNMGFCYRVMPEKHAPRAPRWRLAEMAKYAGMSVSGMRWRLDNTPDAPKPDYTTGVRGALYYNSVTFKAWWRKHYGDAK